MKIANPIPFVLFLVCSPLIWSSELVSLTMVEEGHKFSFHYDQNQGVDFHYKKPRTYVSQAKFTSCSIPIEPSGLHGYSNQFSVESVNVTYKFMFNDYAISKQEGKPCEFKFIGGAILKDEVK